jgi:hypothetical protein
MQLTMVDVLILAGHRRDFLCAFTGYDEREGDVRQLRLSLSSEDCDVAAPIISLFY